MSLIINGLGPGLTGQGALKGDFAETVLTENMRLTLPNTPSHAPNSAL
jgi:hypothetical protein